MYLSNEAVYPATGIYVFPCEPRSLSVLGPVSDVRVLGISQPAEWLISIENVAGAEVSGR